METVFLTEGEYEYVLAETLTAPFNQMEVSINLHPHPITNDKDLNNAICRYRTVRFKRDSEPNMNKWLRLTDIRIITPIAP